VFEVAVELSRNMGCGFISPEHLACVLLDTALQLDIYSNVQTRTQVCVSI
jgi:hypothetical protein